jgi:peptide-methionine (S)-S-oxide reductase
MSREETAYLAGGCFWGMQDLFRKLPGVLRTRVGYAGGRTEAPTYDTVKTGRTGHAESLEVVFDPDRISYRDILARFFQIHDPTTRDRQGNDRGTQYRSAIFYADDAQAETARGFIRDAEASGRWPGKFVTEVVPAGPFHEAEDIHQDYLVRYPHGYTCHFPRPDWHL